MRIFACVGSVGVTHTAASSLWVGGGKVSSLAKPQQRYPLLREQEQGGTASAFETNSTS